MSNERLMQIMRENEHLRKQVETIEQMFKATFQIADSATEINRELIKERLPKMRLV